MVPHPTRETHPSCCVVVFLLLLTSSQRKQQLVFDFLHFHSIVRTNLCMCVCVVLATEKCKILSASHVSRKGVAVCVCVFKKLTFASQHPTARKSERKWIVWRGSSWSR